MILNKLYAGRDHFIITYDTKKYVKISYNNNKIILTLMDNINTNVLRELSEAFVLYQFPFHVKRYSNCIEFIFLVLLNSKIKFCIEKDTLVCKIDIDDTIVKEYYVKNFDDNKIRIYLGNVSDIDPLTYIDDIEIYNYKDKGYPYVYLVISKNKYTIIKNLSKKYGWKIISNA